MRELAKHFVIAVAIATIIVDAALAQFPPLRTFTSAPTCTTCSIVIEPGVTLALPNDSLSFGYTSELVRLGDGRFLAWELNETRVPALFDANGRFVRLLARAGNGPSEMGDVDGAFVGRGDTVWVKDQSPWTWHVLAPDLKYLRREPLEPEPVDILFLPNGNSIVATNVSDPGLDGYPLHVVNRRGEVTRSFGVEQRATVAERRNDNSLLRRNLTPGVAGSFWVNNSSRFLLEHYDSSGRSLARLRHVLDGWYQEATEKQPGRGEFNGKALGTIVASNDPQIVWLIYHVRNANFVIPTGALELGVYSGMLDVVVEAFDTRTYRVLASQRFPNISVRSIRNAPDMVTTDHRIDADFATFRVNTLRLVRR